MPIFSSIKNFTRNHEWVGDLFSLFAVVLLFATLWTVLQYNSLILAWIQTNVVVHAPLAALGLVLDILLIFVFLSIGSRRHGPEDKGCFHTFKGRRHGGASVYSAFTNWLSHMEHVGKKHR